MVTQTKALLNGKRPDPITDPVETAAPGFEIDVSDWKMGDYRRWVKAAKDNDIEAMNTIAANVVLAWPYVGNPTDPASYDDIEMFEWGETIRAVEASVTARFRTA